MWISVREYKSTEIVINTDNILYMQKHDDGRARVYLAEGRTFTSEETMDQILNKMGVKPA